MTDAAVAAPAPSASELSENIGDVLASIRRMIAQDAPAADAPARPDVLRLGTAASSASNSGMRWSGAAVPAQRDELLARAQSWTRRAPPGPGTLRLERSEILPPAVTDKATLPASLSTLGEAVPGDMAGGMRATGVQGATAVIDGPAVPAQPALNPGGERDSNPAPTGNGDAAKAAVADVAAATAAIDETAARLELVPQPAAGAAASHPPATAMSAPVDAAFARDGAMAMASDVQPAMAPAAIDPIGPPDWAEPAHGLTETILLETAMNAYAPTPAAAAAVPDDEATDSIFSSMILDVIRQELGDPSGRMSRDLRAMILREVARAITSDPAKRS